MIGYSILLSCLNKIIEYVKIVIYLFSIFKYLLNEKTSLSKTTPYLAACLTIIFLPIFLILLLLLRIYYILIWIILKLKLRKKFHSILEGEDVIFCIEDKYSRQIINILFIIDFKGNSNDFYSVARKEIETIFKKPKFEKFWLIRKMFCQLYYYQRIDVDFNDFINCLRFEQHTPNRDDLQKVLNKFGNYALPKNDTALWEVHIAEKGLEWNAGKWLYPIYFRFHHCIGDASTIFNFFTSEFSQKNQFKVQCMENIIKPKLQSFSQFKNPFITSFGHIDKPDRNIFCGINISGKKYLHFYVERSVKYIPIIKSARIKFGVNFVDIVLTALCASLHKYVVKKNVVFPKVVSTVITILKQNTNNIGNYGQYKYKFENSFTLVLVKLPMDTQNDTSEEKDLIRRLKYIHTQYNIVKNVSIDADFNRWLGDYVIPILPVYISKKIIHTNEPTLMLSNIPGCDHLTFFGNSDVKEFIVIDPNCSTSGISLMVTTYENRLNFSLTVDESVIPNEDDVKNILYDIPKYIDELNNIKI